MLLPIFFLRTCLFAAEIIGAVAVVGYWDFFACGFHCGMMLACWGKLMRWIVDIAFLLWCMIPYLDAEVFLGKLN